MSIVGDIYRVRFVCNTSTQIAINTLYLRCTLQTAPGLDPTQEDIAIQVDTDSEAPYKAMMSADAAYRGVSVQLVTDPLPVFASSIANAGFGTAAGTNVPANVAYVIGTTTAFAGRKWRGRIYPGFPATSFVDSNGFLNAAGLAALQTLASNLQGVTTVTGAAMGSGTFQLEYALQQQIRPPTDPKTYQYFDIVDFLARSKLGTQRRRGAYGRQNALPF